MIRNFKRFGEVDIELGNPVVFIGPNNSGKTTALQALALWDIGVRRWKELDEEVSWAAINRKDLIGLPVPQARMLWRNLLYRRQDLKAKTSRRIPIEILVEGISDGQHWRRGLEFRYANDESLLCRPLKGGKEVAAESILLGQPSERIVFLPAMSGLAAHEPRLDPGAIDVRLAEGRTAEVLRNICYQLATSSPDRWQRVCTRMEELFKVAIQEPVYIPQRGEIQMAYKDPAGASLDLSASGRGLQQMLLLLAYLTLNPRSVLLIDEPDAHLEILRQRQIYQILSDTAREYDSQIVMASHSEVILNEAADRDVVVAFVGRPHRIDDRGSQILKSLKEIGFDQYYQAEQTGWVLYLEGSTDLAILQAFARILDHPAQKALERPFVHYVENKPGKARDHFYGLREARKDLQAFALFDRLQLDLEPSPHLEQWMWTRREIENYLCYPETLLGWARAEAERLLGPLFETEWQGKIEAAIRQIESAMATLGKGSPWSPDTKVSDDFLDPLFDLFFKDLDLPNLMRKTDYHTLARHVPENLIDPEVRKTLDGILAVCKRAHPASG